MSARETYAVLLCIVVGSTAAYLAWVDIKARNASRTTLFRKSVTYYRADEPRKYWAVVAIEILITIFSFVFAVGVGTGNIR